MFWKVDPSNYHKTLRKCFYTHLQGCRQSQVQLLKHLSEQIINGSLENKKNFEESSRKEEGGDEKHIFIFLLGLTMGLIFKI